MPPLPQSGGEGRRRKAALRRRRGISLVETVVVLAVGTILILLSSAALSKLSSRAQNVQCFSTLRALGAAISLYSLDHGGEFPRSLHSAAGAGTLPWGKAVLPYLGLCQNPADAEWERLFQTHYRCPSDKNTGSSLWSYALNVHFELTPDGDDYEGSPQTWRRLSQVPRPAATILLAEPKAVHYADHIMCHQWTGTKGAANAIHQSRHGKTSNYLFVDGHVEPLSVGSTFDPKKGVNRWNPSLAK